MGRKEIWIQKFKDWENSGLKRTEFCRQNNIPVSTFDYWKQRIRKESEESKEKRFVKLPLVLKPSQGSSFSIEYPSGYRINIPSDYESNSLLRLIRDLKEILK